MKLFYWLQREIVSFFWNLYDSFTGEPVARGAIDQPDKRDHIDALPKARLNLPTRVSNFERGGQQYRQNTGEFLGFGTQGTAECTAWGFGITKVLTNLCLHGETIKFDSNLHWDYQCELYNASASTGATLLSSLKVGKEYPQSFPFSEYLRLPKGDLKHLKTRLAMGFSVFSGVYWKKTEDGKSNTYSTTLKTGVYNWFPTATVGAHALAITGYNDAIEMLEVTESLQKNWGGNAIKGKFYVPYKFYEHMMSAYLIRDMKDK